MAAERRAVAGHQSSILSKAQGFPWVAGRNRNITIGRGLKHLTLYLSASSTTAYDYFPPPTGFSLALLIQLQIKKKKIKNVSTIQENTPTHLAHQAWSHRPCTALSQLSNCKGRRREGHLISERSLISHPHGPYLCEHFQANLDSTIWMCFRAGKTSQ
jgi:hypothetical protein